MACVEVVPSNGSWKDFRKEWGIDGGEEMGGKGKGERGREGWRRREQSYIFQGHLG